MRTLLSILLLSTGLAASAATEPTLGKYNIQSFGAPGNPPLYLGHFALLKGGKYKVSRTSKEDYYGSGSYHFDAAHAKVVWDSGPFKDDGWGGAFTVERGGKTHKIRLKGGTVGTHSE